MEEIILEQIESLENIIDFQAKKIRILEEQLDRQIILWKKLRSLTNGWEKQYNPFTITTTKKCVTHTKELKNEQ